MAKALGSLVYATAGSTEKCDFCEQLGADKAINYKNKDFSKKLTGLPTAKALMLYWI
jgi:NADPH2:quinone reductase